MPFCTKCGHQERDDSAFCSDCGTAIASVRPAVASVIVPSDSLAGQDTDGNNRVSQMATSSEEIAKSFWGKLSSKQQQMFITIGLPLCVIPSVLIYSTWATKTTTKQSASSAVAPSNTKSPNTVAAKTTSPCDGELYVNTCFVKPDGKYCSNDWSGPIVKLVLNGNYTVVERSVNERGACVLTLSVDGTVDGNSYSKIVKIWPDKKN
jgi:hypothetical protein